MFSTALLCKYTNNGEQKTEDAIWDNCTISRTEVMMNSIFQLLNPDNTISINRPLAHAIGLDEAIVYGAIISKWYYYSERGMIDEDGWFYSTIPDMRESTAIGEKAQKRCIDNLVKYGLIRCEQRGMPARRSFYIVDDPTIIESLICKGEDIMEEIKPAAAEKNRQKVKQRDEKKSAELPCSAETEEQAPQSVSLFRQNGVTSTANAAEQAPPESADKFRPNGGTGSAETEDKSKYNKSKDKKLNMIVMSGETPITSNSPRSNENTHGAEFDTLRCNLRIPYVPDTPTQTKKVDVENQIRASIKYQLISCVTGPAFADNVVDAIYELLTATKSQTFGDELVSPQDIYSIISRINSDVVMQVSDTIYLKKGKIHDMKAYLKTALFLQTREYLDLPENSFGYEGHGAMREFRNIVGIE